MCKLDILTDDKIQKCSTVQSLISSFIPIPGGANMKLRNHNRDTPLDLSLQMGRADVLEYFMEVGLEVIPRNGNPTRYYYTTLLLSM